MTYGSIWICDAGILYMGDSILNKLVLFLFPIASLGGIWYIVNPKAALRFTARHPGFDRFGKMKKSSCASIRLAGIVIVLFCILCEIGLLAAYGIIR